MAWQKEEVPLRYGSPGLVLASWSVAVASESQRVLASR
jgi:hypothetical protein